MPVYIACPSCGTQITNCQNCIDKAKQNEQQKPPRFELFIDRHYYDMIAVRRIGDRNFNSTELFHFVHEKDAIEFMRLAELSS